ncbi:DUF3006 domain-containing protein [Alkalihalobacillus sp. MEB130]|uniref:DUF3006 domain-containing protein n=1 Tax=Alkalihalobacillus sp. MEB130 TaxID=2976704 RepID=UPI0028DE11F6|nr:DUF3006 domain-containing protein [Alkalihalobacillus sp. MEB130]MDT8860110.1 DUF3006 domain-containing protein [Alkalihalobacillus sp. MEB130]
MVKGVLDRIIDDKYGVILVESLQKEFVVHSSFLPNGSIEGTWLNIEIEGDTIQHIEIDYHETAKAESRIAAKLQHLKISQRGSQFRRRKET